MIYLAVIGSDSYIATHFYNSVESKDNLRLFSRRASGKKNEIIKENLFDISSNDLRGIDVLVNFAAIVHQPRLRDEKLYENINTNLVIHLSDEARKAGVSQFIQMSTIAVYGNLAHIDLNSSETPVNIYGATKLAADKYLISSQDDAFKISVIRPPMVYGVNAPGNMMKLIKYAQKGIPMPFRRVKNERDFIYILNLVSVLNIVIQGKIYGIILPTDKKPVSTAEILNIVKQYSTNKVKIISVPLILLKIGKILIPSVFDKLFGSLRVDCSLSENHYHPSYTPEDGIREMISNKG